MESHSILEFSSKCKKTENKYNILKKTENKNKVLKNLEGHRRVAIHFKGSFLFILGIKSQAPTSYIN